jgi:hypothetical protein
MPGISMATRAGRGAIGEWVSDLSFPVRGFNFIELGLTFPQTSIAQALGGEQKHDVRPRKHASDTSYLLIIPLGEFLILLPDNGAILHH